jgi:hypothetical protein
MFPASLRAAEPATTLEIETWATMWLKASRFRWLESRRPDAGFKPRHPHQM